MSGKNFFTDMRTKSLSETPKESAALAILFFNFLSARQLILSSAGFAFSCFMGNNVSQRHTHVNIFFHFFLKKIIDNVFPMGDNGNIMNKEPRISVRVPPDLKERLQRIIDVTGVDESTIVKRCVEALLDHFDQNGSITFPITIVTADDKISREISYRRTSGDSGSFAAESKHPYQQIKKATGPSRH